MQAEQAVTSALDQATELVESGEHPTTALVKAAQACGLSAGHARLAAVAYNTGRAAFQRETGADVPNKIAEFELADPDLIAAEIAGTQKTAAVSEPQEVSSVYSHPPTFLWEKYKRATAEIEIPNLCETPTAPMPAANTTKAAEAVSFVRSTQRKLADARAVVDKMLRKVAGDIDQLDDAFRVIGSPHLATIKQAATTRNDAGVLAVLNEVERRNPVLGKLAASQSVVLTGAEQRMYQQVADVAQLAGEFITANKKLAEVTEAAAGEMTAALDPFKLKESAGIDPFFELNAAAPKTAGVLQRLAVPMIGAAAGAHDSNPQGANLENYQLALEDPGHDQTLRGLRARTTLEQLRVSDPTLAGYGQGELVRAFNQIVRSAPEAANHPLYMQAMLRRYLGQGNELDPDDVRSNVLGPQKELNSSRLQNIPDVPKAAPRGNFNSAQRMRNAFDQAFKQYGNEGIVTKGL